MRMRIAAAAATVLLSLPALATAPGAAAPTFTLGSRAGADVSRTIIPEAGALRGAKFAWMRRRPASPHFPALSRGETSYRVGAQSNR